MRLSTAFFVAIPLVLLLLAAPARADDVRALRYDTRIDLAVTTVGGVWWLSSELLKTDLVPEKCRWCYRAEDGSDQLNAYDGWVRRKVVWKNPNTAARVSDILDFFVEPATMMGLTALSARQAGAIRGFPVDALLVSEATVIAGDINQLAKFAFARERPFVHFLPRAPDAVRAMTDSPSDDNLSFFSGHSTLAFALATSAGTINTMRGYKLAPVVWGTGLTMATTVAYLRIAADKHYLSDVMIGALVGSAIGVGVPLIFHSPTGDGSSSSNPPSASGQAIVGAPVRQAFGWGGSF